MSGSDPKQSPGGATGDTSSAAPQKTPGLPENFDILTFEGFEGINTKPTRPGIDDQQMFICDNFMPIGKNNLVAMPGPSAALWTAPGGLTILQIFFFNILSTNFGVSFLSDGSAVIFNADTFVGVYSTPAGTFTSPVAVSQFGPTLLLVVTGQTNGFFILDAITYYSPGGAVPPGYPTGPATMPVGIGGQTITAYLGRAWVGNGDLVIVSSPGCPFDFRTSTGSGTTPSNDPFLRHTYTNFIQTNGFLYTVADSSVNYISGVQTSGTTPITTYTNLNVDPQIGTPFLNNATVYSRAIVFMNLFGVHVLYGGAVEKVSGPLDGIFAQAGFEGHNNGSEGGFTPTTAVAIINGIQVFIILLNVVNPANGALGRLPYLWDGKRWWSANQSSIVFRQITTYEINSKLECLGHDGTSIYRLFDQNIGTLKTVQSKLWQTPTYLMEKTTLRVYALLYSGTRSNPSLTIRLDNEQNTGPTIVTTNPIVPGPGIIVVQADISYRGFILGFTITTNEDDVTIISISAAIQHYRISL